MASLFREFTAKYMEFKERFPKHPLAEELTYKLTRGKFPSDEWLKARIAKMDDLLAPLWMRGVDEDEESSGPRNLAQDSEGVNTVDH